LHFSTVSWLLSQFNFDIFIMSTFNDTWEFYLDNAREWRWRRTARNGEIVGASTEGYVNRNDCEANAGRNGWTG